MTEHPLRRMTEQERRDECHDVLENRDAFVEGYIAGLTAFAWWKDGVQYVGTCGTTLKEAVERVRREHAK